MYVVLSLVIIFYRYSCIKKSWAKRKQWHYWKHAVLEKCQYVYELWIHLQKCCNDCSLFLLCYTPNYTLSRHSILSHYNSVSVFLFRDCCFSLLSSNPIYPLSLSCLLFTFSFQWLLLPLFLSVPLSHWDDMLTWLMKIWASTIVLCPWFLYACAVKFVSFSSLSGERATSCGRCVLPAIQIKSHYGVLNLNALQYDLDK